MDYKKIDREFDELFNGLGLEHLAVNQQQFLDFLHKIADQAYHEGYLDGESKGSSKKFSDTYQQGYKDATAIVLELNKAYREGVKSKPRPTRNRVGSFRKSVEIGMAELLD